MTKTTKGARRGSKVAHHMNETWGELFVSIMKWNNGGCDLLQLENGIFGISIGGRREHSCVDPSGTIPAFWTRSLDLR